MPIMQNVANSFVVECLKNILSINRQNYPLDNRLIYIFSIIMETKGDLSNVLITCFYRPRISSASQESTTPGLYYRAPMGFRDTRLTTGWSRRPQTGTYLAGKSGVPRGHDMSGLSGDIRALYTHRLAVIPSCTIRNVHHKGKHARVIKYNTHLHRLKAIILWYMGNIWSSLCESIAFTATSGNKLHSRPWAAME